MTPAQSQQLMRIKVRVEKLGLILEECGERAQWQKHYRNSHFFKQLSADEVKRLRANLEEVISELETELLNLWNAINRYN